MLSVRHSMKKYSNVEDNVSSYDSHIHHTHIRTRTLSPFLSLWSLRITLGIYRSCGIVAYRYPKMKQTAGATLFQLLVHCVPKTYPQDLLQHKSIYTYILYSNYCFFFFLLASFTQLESRWVASVLRQVGEPGEPLTRPRPLGSPGDSLAVTLLPTATSSCCILWLL